MSEPILNAAAAAMGRKGGATKGASKARDPEKMRLAAIESARVRRIQKAGVMLYDALQTALRVLVTVEGFPDKDKGRTAEQQSAFDQARAALAEAEKPGKPRNAKQ